MKKYFVATQAVLWVALALCVGCASADGANSESGQTGQTEGSAAETTASKPADGAQDDGDDSEDAKPGSKGSDAKSKGKGKGKGDKEEKKEEAVPVEVAVLGRGPIEAVLRFSANLEAENDVQVFSQAKRLVTRLLVEEGDRAKQGQLLARLQDDEQRSALAKVEIQLAKAKREYEQQKRLYAQELISEQVFNDATHELEQLEISIEDAKRELGYAEVRAPISGTITARLVNLGDQVQIGQHLFDIVDFDSIVARVFVPEKNLRELRNGLPARIHSSAVGPKLFEASVERIAPVVDPKSGTVKVTVAVGGQPGLRPGMYVDVDLVTATHREAVLVPKRALVYDNDQMFVYRLGDDRRVERVFFEPMLGDKEHIVPRAGLGSGDQVVTAGQAGLKDGALVSLPGEEEERDESPTDANAERASL